MTDIVCELSDCTFRYADAESGAALRNATLRVRAGEVVVLTGRSGCGKTTVTRMLNGLAPEHFAGQLDGRARTADCIAGETSVNNYVTRVGSVFQNPKTQYFHANSSDELAFPCENVGMEPAQIRARISARLREFDIEHLRDRTIIQLSGGQQQQLAVAAATMLDPHVFVLDEPTGNLDVDAIERLRTMLMRLKRDGNTIVIAEHRLAWCAGLADRYVLFDSGQITGEYSAHEFAALPAQQLRDQGLRSRDLSEQQQRIERIIAQAESAETIGNPALLSTKNLVVGYGGRGLLAHITHRRAKNAFAREVPDVDLRGGQIIGLMGCNGAGKSTFARTVCGLGKPLSGEILLDGKLAKPAKLANNAAMVMQDVNYQLFADSVREEVMLETEMSGGADAADMRSARERCDEILRELDLLEFADRHPMSLSGGQKQRLAIATALMARKQLVVLDEPTSGLDYTHMMQVGELLRRLADRGVCVLVITHDEELAAHFCDRILRFD